MVVKSYIAKNQPLREEMKWIEDIIRKGGYCPSCGYRDDPRILEGHHVGGRKNDPFLVTLCPNCHRELTQKQLSVIEIKDRDDNDNLTILGLILNGIADLLMLIGRVLKEWSRKIFEGVIV